MVEAILLFVVVGLFISGVFFLRMLMRRQVNQTLNILIESWDDEAEKVKEQPVPKTPLVLQEATKFINN